MAELSLVGLVVLIVAVVALNRPRHEPPAQPTVPAISRQELNQVAMSGFMDRFGGQTSWSELFTKGYEAGHFYQGSTELLETYLSGAKAAYIAQARRCDVYVAQNGHVLVGRATSNDIEDVAWIYRYSRGPGLEKLVRMQHNTQPQRVNHRPVVESELVQ